MKCDNCNEKASIHLTEIREGKQINKALCVQCAIQIGGMTDTTKMPINEVLTRFVLAHSGLQKEAGEAAKPETGSSPATKSEE